MASDSRLDDDDLVDQKMIGLEWKAVAGVALLTACQ